MCGFKAGLQLLHLGQGNPATRFTLGDHRGKPCRFILGLLPNLAFLSEGALYSGGFSPCFLTLLPDYFHRVLKLGRLPHRSTTGCLRNTDRSNQLSGFGFGLLPSPLLRRQLQRRSHGLLTRSPGLNTRSLTLDAQLFHLGTSGIACRFGVGDRYHQPGGFGLSLLTPLPGFSRYQLHLRTRRLHSNPPRHPQGPANSLRRFRQRLGLGPGLPPSTDPIRGILHAHLSDPAHRGYRDPLLGLGELLTSGEDPLPRSPRVAAKRRNL